MNLLIDTHTLLWIFAEPDNVPARAASAMNDPLNVLWISIVSLWEMTIKSSKGGLDIGEGGIAAMLDDVDARGLKHLTTLETLPRFHKDRFDRLLVSQAIAENMTLVTVDSKLSEYPVRTLWQ